MYTFLSGNEAFLGVGITLQFIFQLADWEIHHCKLIVLLEGDFHGYLRSLCWGNDKRRDWDDVLFSYCYLKGEPELEVFVNPLSHLYSFVFCW